MPKIRPLVESPSVAFLVLSIALLLGCIRCGGGGQQAPDSATAASPPAEPSSDGTAKEVSGEQRPGYCRDVNGTVSICSDDANRQSVDEATSLR